MILFDTNVLLDIATADPVWLAWSEKQFRSAAAEGPIPINPIIYAELAPAFATEADLNRWLEPAIFQRLPLPYSAGWLASQAFLSYRRTGGIRSSPLPDFYIGAHAEIENRTLITRDAARYRTYFPNVRIVAPSPGLGSSDAKTH
jgi:predicted nucleic acid-binding protein